MSIAQSVLAVNDDLPIRTHLPVHSGKVRSVYWLTPEDSARLIAQKGYDVAPDAPLAVMVISDRISAFDCIWRAEGDVRGVPGKGAALNAISNHWFRLFKARGLADSHILDIPHPFVWIVQKARPVMVEAICRAYITGSMWRAYSKGERDFCGIQLPEGLKANQKLDDLLMTPSTKGVIRGVAGVPEADDVNVTRQQLLDNLSVFGFRKAADVDLYETLLKQGFGVISEALARAGQLFVDTKFEFGYVTDSKGVEKLIYMDEVGTPDSSRMWDAAEYKEGRIVENSKEGFRQFLLNHFPDPDIMLNKDRFDERVALARDNTLPLQSFMDLSHTYTSVAEKITGQPIVLSDNPKAEITQVLADQFDLIK